MKKSLILVLVLATISIANAQNLHKEYYKDGQLKEIGKRINYTKEGKWKYYYKNGQLESVGRYKDDKKVKKWREYHENGQLKSIGRYKINKEGHGYKTGKWKTYYDTGKLREKGYYEGLNKRNNSGDFYQKTGKWVYIDLFGDGNKSISNYKNGVNSGLQQIFHKDGWLYGAAIYYNKGKNAHFILYYPSGKVHQKWEIENNKAQGKYQKFYRNGKIKLEGEENEGAFNGIVKTYHENGQLYQIQEWVGKYSSEKLINITACFDSKGEPIDKGTLKDGNGTVKEYINDELVNILTFEDGREKNKQVFVFNHWNDWERLNNVAWNAYERTEDKILNKFTLKWIERSIELDRNYYNLDSYCAFLYRDKQYKKAVKIGVESIKLGKKNKIDTTETEKFVVEIKNKLKQ